MVQFPLINGSGGRRSGLMLALLGTLFVLEIRAGIAGTPSLAVDGTLFRITSPDGRVLTSPDLIGGVFDAVDDAGRTITLRIDAVTRDPSDTDGDVWLHRFSVPAIGAKEGWREFCTSGPDGTTAGFPLLGAWTNDGRHERRSGAFTITCTSGAAGKCVRMGYKPWREVRGQDLWDYHQACVRALRADYGGDGVGYTRDGTLIEISDKLGIQSPEPDPRAPTLQFETAWGADGAVCVRRTRIPELLSTTALAERYPHLAGKIGPNCFEGAAGALIWNRS